MYTFSSKLKIVAFALIIVGLIGVAYGFLSTPSSVEDVKVMLEKSHDSHGEVAASHEVDTHVVESESHEDSHADTAHSDDTHAEHAFHYLKNKPWSA